MGATNDNGNELNGNDRRSGSKNRIEGGIAARISNYEVEDNDMKIIKTAAFFRLATAATSPKLKDEVKESQSTDTPVRRPSGDEEPEHEQVAEARLNRLRQNWYETAGRRRSRR